jgi:hypothetical protein
MKIEAISLVWLTLAPDIQPVIASDLLATMASCTSGGAG